MKKEWMIINDYIQSINNVECLYETACELWIGILAEIQMLWDEYALNQKEITELQLDNWIKITINLNRN